MRKQQQLATQTKWLPLSYDELPIHWTSDRKANMQVSEEETLDGVIGRHEREEKKSLVIYHLRFLICHLRNQPQITLINADLNGKLKKARPVFISDLCLSVSSAAGFLNDK
jgi:hypothetical protein